MNHRPDPHVRQGRGKRILALSDRTSLPDALVAYLILYTLVESRAWSFLGGPCVRRQRRTRLHRFLPYRQIAEIIRRRIGSGQYQSDTRITTKSEIVEEFEVARPTARVRWPFCARKGWCMPCPTRGSYVTRPSSSQTSEPSPICIRIDS